MLHDLRLAVRSLAKSPGFSAVVVLLLALGIGANTAIFSVVRAVMLRPLPMEQPDRLVRLRENFANGGEETQLNLSPLTWQRWRQYNDVFTDIAVATGASLTLTGEGDAQYVPAAVVSDNFFSVLGVRPLLGRNFLPEEDQPGGPRVVLLSHGFWQRVLGGAPNVIGRVLTLDGEKRTVVGVMPPNFRHPYRAELWTPIALAIGPTSSNAHYLYAPARLKPGVSLEQAHRSLRALCERLAHEFPDPNSAREARIVSLQDSFVRDSRPKLLAVTAAAAFVLLIAGANIASLMLARHIARETETSVRAALGATRGRLLREQLAQSLVLAVAGGLAGVLLAAWLTGPLYALSPMASDATGNAMREFDTTVHLDGTVLAVTTALTLFVGLGFGLLPALRGTRGNLQLALKGGSRGATLDRGARRTLGTLVIVEVAVAVVLLVATGLLVKSFRALLDQPWGFDLEQRLTFNVAFSARLRPEHAARVTYLEQALEKLRALPGVVSATATTPDLVAFGRNLAAVTPQGSTPPEARGYFLINHRLVTPGYFQDSGIPIVRGRALDATDRVDGQKVAVVSETFAKNFWPGQDPIGKSIKRGRPNDPRPPYVVVGVAADIRGTVDATDGNLPGLWYLPYAQNPNYLSDDVTFVVHTRVPPASLQSAVRAEMAKVDRNLAPYEFNLLTRLVDDTYVEDRFSLLLVTLFGVLGLVLSAVGLYGLLSFQVSRRTRELGVRTALGAQAGALILLVFRQGAWLVAAGLASGLAASLAFARMLESQLHGISAADPTAYLLAATVLTFAAALACWFPARRAARIDPMVALRNE